MSEHYDFHYQPTGSGAISGQQVLEQTEDAINELGDYVNDNVGGAMDVAQQALETAQNAETNAQTALDTANSFSSAIQSAQQDASTALSTAQTAQTTASNANNTAIQASQDASNAVTTANNASGQVTTLSGTVTALGQRVTTAEGNIGQNTSDITALTTRVGTAEGNITTLQNDVSIAQGNASSAMATAGTVKQQAYVFRYSSTALVASSTNSNTLLDNTDNLKVGDKVIDSDGVLFSITAIDTVNSTFTVGSALIDLALDGDVVHRSSNETITGNKTFGKGTLTVNNGVGTNVHGEIKLAGSRSGYIVADSSGDGVFDNVSCGISILLQDAGKPLHVGSYKVDSNGRVFVDNTNKNPVLTVKGDLIKSSILIPENDTSDNAFIISSELTYANSDSSKALNVVFRQYDDANATSAIYSNTNNVTSLGIPTRKWSKIYGTEYYYGSNNVEFSTKFVTTDTAQTISGDKVWTGTNTFQQNVTYQRTNFFHQASGPCYILKDTNLEKGSLVASSQASYPGLWQDKNNNVLGYMRFVEYSSGRQTAEFRISNLIKNGALDPTGSEVNCTVLLELQPSGEKSLIPEQNNDINLGTSANKWKSFNGLTPSSLSMPSDRSARVDISSYITNLGNGDNNQYIVPANGYIWLHFTSINSALCYSQTSGGLTNYAQTFVRYQGDGQLYAFFPVRKDDYFIVQIYTSSTAVVQNAYFIPCQGNV